MKIPIPTYSELSKYAEFFRSGRLPIMIFEGPPGVGKSHTIKAAVPEAVLIEGSMSALGLYEAVHRAQNRPIVIDDIDDLFRDRNSVRLLKALCQTQKVRHVSWTKSTSYLAKAGIPLEYETSSPICIIANEWQDSDINLRALADRGLHLQFSPSAMEVHTRARELFSDEEVYNFITMLLPYARNLSFRTYAKAATFSACGLDWRTMITESWGIDREIAVIVELEQNPSFCAKQRIEYFSKRTGSSKATYYRKLKELKRVRS